jgi:hypothetical protein
VKLTEVSFREGIRDDAGSILSFLREHQGYTLTYDAGLVTVAHKAMANGRIVPVSNVASMTPAPVKAGK